jgi:flagellin-like hook-associated protein FlgL
MGDIVLSAGVRQNLLSLQTTADLMSLTQNRLATGKKVNSALDNPGNYFTSQALSNRAGDLNALLDSIGQAQQTLRAADQGLTSLTKLVESAKSIAKQARQASQPGSAVYSAISLTGNPADEALGTTGNGTAITVANATTYSFDININGAGAETVTYTSDASATYAEILAGLQASFATALTNSGVTSADAELVANGGGDGIRINALDEDIDFVISANTGAGLTNNTYNSTSLLDNIVTAGGAAGDTLTLGINGGASNVVTFGTGAGEISTLAELHAVLNTVSGLTATANSSTINFSVASGTSQNSVSLASSTAGVTTALGIGGFLGTTQGTATVGAPDPTRASLQADFNNVLEQIDALAGDASYNGINLLNGDDLKVVFNENGTSSLTIAGVVFDAAGLGLNPVAGAGFQSDGDIDTTIAAVDIALKTLRTQASAFGANLTTVETRQNFTKGLIQVLETGSDNLVLADTNEEGANLLALQTRQQLSTTALSLSAQADQAVLRLFG